VLPLAQNRTEDAPDVSLFVVRHHDIVANGNGLSTVIPTGNMFWTEISVLFFVLKPVIRQAPFEKFFVEFHYFTVAQWFHDFFSLLFKLKTDNGFCTVISLA